MSDSKIDWGQIAQQNLALLSEESTIVEEEKQLLLYEFYHAHLDKAASFSTAAKQLLSHYYGRKAAERGKKLPHSEVAKEKALLAKLLAEHYTEADISNSIEYSCPAESSGRIAYWPSNHFSTQAFQRFTSLFDSVDTISAENFNEICEFISGDKCEFGIIPIENSTDGRLSSFYRMLDRYEFKINAICNIEDEMNESFTRFALISKKTYRFHSKKLGWIEMSTVSANAKKIVDLIHAAECFGMQVTRLSSTPLYYRGNACVDTITLSLPECSPLPFFIYLYLFYKDINILGLFIQV